VTSFTFRSHQLRQLIHPLAEILNGFAAAGLVIERVAESGPRPVPITLAIRACKPS
jgi:hypothetical protein